MTKSAVAKKLIQDTSTRTALQLGTGNLMKEQLLLSEFTDREGDMLTDWPFPFNLDKPHTNIAVLPHVS